MQIFLSNAFNDPSDPWYYVIGIIFLALIFGALALYIVLDNRRKNKNGGDTAAKTPSDAQKDHADTDSTDDQTTEIRENTQNSDSISNSDVNNKK